jgi:Flp pilus assembly protein TadD
MGAPFPLLWPRRTAGERLRVIALASPTPDAVAAEALAVLLHLPEDRYDLTIAICGGNAVPALAGVPAGRMPRVIAVGPTGDPPTRRPRCSIPTRSSTSRLCAGACASRSARDITTVARPCAGWRRWRVVADGADVPSRRWVPNWSACAGRSRRHRVFRCAGHGGAGMAVRRISRVRFSPLGSDTKRSCACSRPCPAHYLLGIVLRQSGDPAAARAQFSAAVVAAPGFVDARVAAATAAQAAGDPQEAIRLCTEGLAQSADSLPLHRTLGLAQLAVHDGAAAATAFERALALAPNDAETHYNHGVALQMQDRGGDASQAYQRALALKPDFVAAHFNLGVLFQLRGVNDATAAATVCCGRSR